MNKRKTAIIALTAAIFIVLGALVFLRDKDDRQIEDISGKVDSVTQKIRMEAEKEIAEKKAAEKAAREKAKRERAKREKLQKEKKARDKRKRKQRRLSELKRKMSLSEDYKEEFIHGEKGKKYQKYIMLHDTESGGTADTVITKWMKQGKKIASHFIINKDGTVVQCVPMDRIAHHAGFGNNGHNKKFGVTDESRDDKEGTESIGPEYPDYGMNSYSIGIEMIHKGSTGESYPAAQLRALDSLIAYIDSYYGKKSRIIDHKMWRLSNGDTSDEFAGYLENYMDHRKHH